MHVAYYSAQHCVEWTHEGAQDLLATANKGKDLLAYLLANKRKDLLATANKWIPTICDAIAFLTDRQSWQSGNQFADSKIECFIAFLEVLWGIALCDCIIKLAMFLSLVERIDSSSRKSQCQLVNVKRRTEISQLAVIKQSDITAGNKALPVYYRSWLFDYCPTRPNFLKKKLLAFVVAFSFTVNLQRCLSL